MINDARTIRRIMLYDYFVRGLEILRVGRDAKCDSTCTCMVDIVFQFSAIGHWWMYRS